MFRYYTRFTNFRLVVKVSITSIAALYLFFNLGLGMNQHYCMGFLKEVSFGHEEHKCCCAGSEIFEDCCEDVRISLSIDDDQIQKTQIDHQINWKFNQQSFIVFNSEISVSGQIHSFTLIRPPPKKSNSRTFIQSLVLYA